MLDDFSKTKGYVSAIVTVPVSQWAAPKDPNPNPKARFLQSPDCLFYKWDGKQWIVDTKTSEEFIAWANVNVVKGPPMLSGHPADMFMVL
jgi:hypothetical protein